MKKEYYKGIQEVLSEQKSSFDGLSTEQVKEKTVIYGKNKLEEAKKESILLKFLKELTQPMTIVLIAAAILSMATSIYQRESFVDFFVIMFVVIMNAVLGVFQEKKAEAAIDALQKMSAAKTKVIRNGAQMIVNSEDIVPGDILSLEAGDAVPADARIIECASLKVEEAALTGESVSVEKNRDTIEEGSKDIPLGDRKNMLYMGSSVTYGRGKAVVCSTGMDTEIGKIATALTEAKKEETPLQLKLNQLSKILTVIVLIVCAVVFTVNIGRTYFLTGKLSNEILLNTAMIAISLAVAAIPEGLSSVVTILLSIGVTKMSKNKAIIRKLTAVETLGCTQIICSDKTGTLTQNKMTVVDHFGSDLTTLMSGMALCSDAELNEENTEAVGEATECALVNDALSHGFNKNTLKQKFPRKAEAPFDSERKMMSTIHENEGYYTQFTKGAPDEILKRCTKVFLDGKAVELTQELKDEILKKNKEFADQALRILALAMRSYEELPVFEKSDEIEKDLIFAGLSAMKDPIRPEVKDAIVQCKKAGIRAIMITGDHKDTAAAIAKELGILTEGQKAITGLELDEISDEELNRTIQDYSVYARVQPEHKIRIVDAWQYRGNVVSMTGDGVNDAPAIKSADIGVAMGITGTDVTKNVADMILADDNFSTIVKAVAEGRRIYDNMIKAIEYLLSSNLAEVLAVFIASMLGFSVLKPIHLLWINLITDTFPAIGIGMEEGSSELMDRAPRKKNESVFADGVGIDIIFHGTTIAILTLAAYLTGHYIETGVMEFTNSNDGITMAFLTLSLLEIMHAYSIRDRKKSVFQMKANNRFLLITFFISSLLTIAVVTVPALRMIFSFEAISFKEFVIALVIAAIIIPVEEIGKLIKRRKAKTETE